MVFSLEGALSVRGLSEEGRVRSVEVKHWLVDWFGGLVICRFVWWFVDWFDISVIW